MEKQRGEREQIGTESGKSREAGWTQLIRMLNILLPLKKRFAFHSVKGSHVGMLPMLVAVRFQVPIVSSCHSQVFFSTPTGTSLVTQCGLMILRKT